MNSKKEKWTFTVIQDVILAVVINTTAAILSGVFPGVWLYLRGCVCAFSINILSGVLLPVERWGELFGTMVVKSGKEPFNRIARVFLINAVYVTIISFSMALIQNGLIPGIVKIWFATYPALHLTGLITSLLTGPPIEAFAVRAKRGYFHES